MIRVLGYTKQQAARPEQDRRAASKDQKHPLPPNRVDEGRKNGPQHQRRQRGAHVAQGVSPCQLGREPARHQHNRREEGE